jgi:two-component system NtrC family sensor kinase
MPGEVKLVMGKQFIEQVETGLRSITSSLGFRLLFLLLLVSAVVFIFLTTFIIRANTKNIMEEMILSAKRTNELVIRSVHYSMLLNRKEDVAQIFNSIHNAPGIESIRFYNKKGNIRFSTNSEEIGQMVDLKAEQCIVCHSSEKPLEYIPESMRPRIFTSPEGHRVLAVIKSIRNEPACAAPGCHPPPSERKILGVLDSKFSLAHVDDAILTNRNQMILYSIGAILIIELLAGLFIMRMVHTRVVQLAEGPRKVKQGDLNFSVQVKGNDEIADLAHSFNSMVASLRRAEAENTELSKKMIHVAKMASMGKLAASVAHEINNPLGGILTYAKLLSRQIGAGPMTEKERQVALEQLDTVIHEIKRCGNIVKNLLHFSRSPEFLMEEVDIHHLIGKSLFITNHHLEMNNIHTLTHLEAKDPVLTGNANQIQQALIAIFINAVEAMGKGGRLTVRTEDVFGSDSICVRVEDTGKGIPEEIRSNIFEPFFTTKENSNSIGLGLSVVYGIVMGHQGKIEVESTEGRGTVFILTLPRKRKPEIGQETVIEGTL